MRFWAGRRRVRWAAWLAVSIGSCAAAWASLGGSASSVEADRVALRANVQVTQAEGYSLHTMAAPGGTVVNEYVSAAGTVFAVAWHGPFMPQMQQILGEYFDRYTAALQAQAQHYGHHPLNIQEAGFVLQTGGHMRDHFGRAYIPEMLPAGVQASAIR